MTAKKIPAAGATAPGLESNPDKRNEDMTNVSPADDTDSVTYLDLTKGEATIDEIAWAEANLASLPVVVLCDESREVKEWQSDNGNWYRKAGTVIVTPHTHRRFRINLFKGADTRDLMLLHLAVTRAQGGRFARFGWEPTQMDDGTAYKFAWSLWTDHDQPRVNKWGQPLPTIYPCPIPACVETYHEGDRDDWIHRTQPIETDQYSIMVEKREDQDDWRIEIYATDFYGTVNQVGGFISDLEWATAECRKLNTLHPTIQKVAA